MTDNARLAGKTIGTLTGLGVTRFVVCAGARNIPLLTGLAGHPGLRIWNHFDERSAAFFALGLARSSGEPVAVVTTSGTAAAELLPAVIEGWYSRVPLVAVTADRPRSFRGSGAPQSIEQAGLFERFTAHSFDLEIPADFPDTFTWDGRTPLHFNACFEDPGAEAPIPLDGISRKRPAEPKPSPHERSPALRNPVVLVGELRPTERREVREFLESNALPAWFECTSGLREVPGFGDRRLLSEASLSGAGFEEVIRIGGVPSLRFWRDLESSPEVRVWNFTSTGFPGLARKAGVFTLAFEALSPFFPEDLPPSSPARTGTEDEAIISALLEKHPASEPAVIRRLSEMIPEEAIVFLGNSLPIREWNLAASTGRAHPRCHANRGANGIDGEVSTFFGLAASAGESWGIFGDLTALYDLNAPWILDQLPGARRRIVILNNGGGRIFSRLPAVRGLDGETAALIENRHSTRFSSWAELWDLDYLHWNGGGTDWTLPESDALVVEIEIDPQASENFWTAYTS